MPSRIAEHPFPSDQWLYVTPDFIVGQFKLPAIAPEWSLENQIGSGKQMRNMLQVPNVTLPDSPLGSLPQSSGGGAGGRARRPGATPPPASNAASPW